MRGGIFTFTFAFGWRVLPLRELRQIWISSCSGGRLLELGVLGYTKGIFVRYRLFHLQKKILLLTSILNFNIIFYNYIFSTPVETPRGQALIGIGFAIGLLFGPVVGGAFAKNHSITWRWAIYINIPVLVFLIVGWIISLPVLYLGQTTGHPTVRFRNIDFLGWLLYSVFFIMLCSSFISSDTRWEWGSELCTAAWVFTGILGTVYVAQQTFCIFTTPENRIFPVRVLRERILILLILSVAMAAAAYGISLYYTPLFFAFTQNATPFEIGLDLIPFIGNFVGTTIVANILLSRLRLYAPLYVLGGNIIIIGSALQNLVTVDNPKSFILGKLAVVGAGLGLVFQTGGSVFKAVAAGDAIREGDYITAFVTLQISGVALFISMGGCIFQNLGVKYVREAIEQYIYGILVPNDGIVRKMLAGLGSELIGGQQLIVELRRKMAENVTEIIRKLYFIIIIAGATILLYRCFIPWGRLNFISANKAKMDKI